MRTVELRLPGTVSYPEFAGMSSFASSSWANVMDMQTIAYWFISAFVLVVALTTYLGSRRKSACMCKAKGVVVAHEESHEEVNVWAPIVQFTTADGQFIQFTERGYSQIRRPVGRRVTVLYSEKSPRNAMLGGFRALYGVPAACLLISLILLIGAIWRSFIDT